MKLLNKWLLAGALLLAALGGIAYAGGLYTNGLPVATFLTGNETIPADTNLSGGRSPQTEAITPALLRAFSGADASYSANAATTNAVATVPQLTGNAGFVVLDMTGTLAGGATLTTPTAAQLIAGLPSLPTGGSYTVRIIAETAANNWTLTAGSNVTVTGTATIVAAQYTDWIVTFNQTLATPTVVFQRAGSGTK